MCTACFLVGEPQIRNQLCVVYSPVMSVNVKNGAKTNNIDTNSATSFCYPTNLKNDFSATGYYFLNPQREGK